MANMVLSAILKAKDNMSPAFKKARQNLGSLGSRLKGVGGNVGTLAKSFTKLLAPLGLLSGLGGIASVAGLWSMVKSTAELGDKIANLAKETGVTAEFLQEYGYVVESCNMESQDFYNAMEKMNGNMGKLRAGTGPLVSGLQKVSPALLKQLKATKSNEEAFSLMLGALGKVTDAEKKAYLATLFFGEGNKKMANLVDLSAEELSRLRQRAHELGLVLDDDALASSQEFNDSLTELKNAAKGLKTTIGSMLIPVITPLLEKLSGWIAANRELIATKIEKYVKQFADWLKKVDFDKILKGVTSLIEGLGNLVDSVGGVGNALIGLWAIMNAGSIVSLMGSLVALTGPLGLIVGLTAAAGLGLNALFKKQYEKYGRDTTQNAYAVTGVDENGEAEYTNLADNAYAYVHSNAASIAGPWKPKENSKILQQQKYYDAKRAGFGNVGLQAAMAGMAAPHVQQAKADITVDFRHVIPGTNIEYTTSGDGINLKLDTAYGPGPQ